MQASRASTHWTPRPSGESLRQPSAARPSGVRTHNLSVVLREIRDDATATRARIAARVGLTRATVSDLVEGLIRAGLVTETQTEPRGRAGRPGMRLALTPGRFAALGLEVQADSLSAYALDLTGHTVRRQVETGDYRSSDSSATLDRLTALATPLRERLAADGIRVVGASLALPGIVSDQRWVHLAPTLGWRDIDLAADLSDRLDADVFVHNDADMAARAEMSVRARAGLAERATNLFFVAGGVGIGGALIVDGGFVSGQHGWGGELGHTTVDPTGPRCGCGAFGCLEVYAGRHVLLEAAGLGWDATMQELGDRYLSGDERARTSVDDAGRALGFAVSNLLNIVDVGSVVLGGIYAPLFDHLAPTVGEAVQAHVLSARWRDVSVEPALAGPEASVVGAALTSLDRLVADPSPWLVTAEAERGADA